MTVSQERCIRENPAEALILIESLKVANERLKSDIDKAIEQAKREMINEHIRVVQQAQREYWNYGMLLNLLVKDREAINIKLEIDDE